MKMIENWRKVALKRWSTWFASLNAALWTAISAKTGALLGFLPFLGYLPGHLRAACLVFVFMVSWGIPVVIAATKQANLSEKNDG